MNRVHGTQCCAPGCNKRKQRKIVGVGRSESEGSSDDESEKKRKFPRTFHRFPADEKRKQRWVLSINRPDWSPTIYSRICSDHFLEKCIFYRHSTGRIQLKKDAIPTRFKKCLREKRTRNPNPYPINQTLLLNDGANHPDSSSTAGNNDNLAGQTTGSPTTTDTSQQQLLSTTTGHNDKNSNNTDDHTNKLKYKILRQNERIVTIKKKLKVSQQSTRRLKQKVESLKAYIKQLEGWIPSKRVKKRKTIQLISSNPESTREISDCWDHTYFIPATANNLVSQKSITSTTSAHNENIQQLLTTTNNDITQSSTACNDQQPLSTTNDSNVQSSSTNSSLVKETLPNTSKNDVQLYPERSNNSNDKLSLITIIENNQPELLQGYDNTNQTKLPVINISDEQLLLTINDSYKQLLSTLNDNP